MSEWFISWGSDSGGMFVELEGIGLDNRPKKINIFHKVMTKKNIKEVKLKNAAFLKYLKDNRIMLEPDRFQHRKVH